jgi:hypothetical protein
MIQKSGKVITGGHSLDRFQCLRVLAGIRGSVQQDRCRRAPAEQIRRKSEDGRGRRGVTLTSCGDCGCEKRRLLIWFNHLNAVPSQGGSVFGKVDTVADPHTQLTQGIRGV